MANAKDKFIKAMAVRGMAKSTQKSYLNALSNLSKFYSGRLVESITDDEVQEFIYDRVKRKLSWPYINVHVSAFRFFYGKTLRKNLSQFVIPCPKMRKKLPQVMSAEEVRRALEVVRHIPRQFAFFSVLYGCGLRGREACGLRVADIDSGNKALWVRNGKGGKDRRLYLPPVVYGALGRYWHAHCFTDYVFPGYHDTTRPMVVQRARDWFRELKDLAGIRKEGALHMWRHTYATHMVEAGHSLLTLKRALGHTSLKSTMVYLHLSAGRKDEQDSPIDHLYQAKAVKKQEP